MFTIELLYLDCEEEEEGSGTKRFVFILRFVFKLRFAAHCSKRNVLPPRAQNRSSIWLSLHISFSVLCFNQLKEKPGDICVSTYRNSYNSVSTHCYLFNFHFYTRHFPVATEVTIKSLLRMEEHREQP